MTGSTGEGRLWGGRFAGGPSPELEALSRSTHFDWRLVPYDLAGSVAHANALHARRSAHRRRPPHVARAGWPPSARSTTRRRWRRPVRRGRPRCSRATADRAGRRRGGRPPAGRPQSRNDQVATLFKAYLRDQARTIGALVLDLVEALAVQARDHLDVVMPGRTHLQHAQPVLLSHHLLAHAWPLLRDVDRLRDWDARVAGDSPYGSGALAGSSLGLDPQAVAAELGLHRLERQLDRRHGRPRLRGRVRVRHGHDRHRPEPARRGDRALVDRGVRLRPARRRAGRPGRASCRRRRTPTSPSWRAASPAA